MGQICPTVFLNFMTFSPQLETNVADIPDTHTGFFMTVSEPARNNSKLLFWWYKMSSYSCPGSQSFQDFFFTTVSSYS